MKITRTKSAKSYSSVPTLGSLNKSPWSSLSSSAIGTQTFGFAPGWPKRSFMIVSSNVRILWSLWLNQLCQFTRVKLAQSPLKSFNRQNKFTNTWRNVLTGCLIFTSCHKSCLNCLLKNLFSEKLSIMPGETYCRSTNMSFPLSVAHYFWYSFWGSENPQPWKETTP